MRSLLSAVGWFFSLFRLQRPQTLEDEIFNLLRRRPVLDVSQISTMLLVMDFDEIESALRSLMEQGVVQSYYEEDTNCVVYRLATI